MKLIEFNKRHRTAFCAALIACAGLITSCHNTIGADKDTSNDLTLPAIKIDTTTALITKDYMGSIEGKINVELRPQVEGILQEIYVDEGDYVKAGQSLFKIDTNSIFNIFGNCICLSAGIGVSVGDFYNKRPLVRKL